MAKPQGQVFISYSHRDRRFLDELLTHLKPLSRAIRVSWWSDREIQPGMNWPEQIRTARASANVAVMLVTKDFLASDFISDQELGPLLKEAERGGVQILWVRVRACSYAETPLGNYQALIPPNKPLAEMRDRDKAWVQVCEGIKNALESFNTEAAPSEAFGDERPQPALELLVHLADGRDLIFGGNEFAGTRGQSLALEGFQLRFKPPVPNLGMRYMAHLADRGDSPWVGEGQFVGSRGEQRAVEGFAIQLTGPASAEFSVLYMAHLAHIGDTPFCENEKGLLGSAAPKGRGSGNSPSAAESSKPCGELNRDVRPTL